MTERQVPHRSLVLGLVLALATPCAAAAAPLQTLRIETIPTDDATPLLWAQQSGMFAKAGIDVRIDKAGSGAAIAAAILAGSYDVGLSNLVTLSEAHARGVGFTLLAPAGAYESKTPFSELVVAHDSPIRAGKELNGKTVATPALDSLSTLVISAWVDAQGGDSHSLKFVELPISATPAALAAHRIDAALMNDTVLASALAAGTVRILGPALDAVAPEFPYSGWFASAAWAASHRDLVRAFVRIMAEATAYTNAHKPQTAALLASFTGADLAVVQKANRSDSGTALRLSQVQPLIDLAAKYKFIARPFPAAEIIDPAAVKP